LILGWYNVGGFSCQPAGGELSSNPNRSNRYFL
jgi:hypothetical protein